MTFLDMLTNRIIPVLREICHVDQEYMRLGRYIILLLEASTENQIVK